MPSSFFSIPPELQIQILCNLNAVSLFRCAMTCTCLYDTLKNSALLTYIIQLHFDGLKDAGTSIPAADSIAHLLRRRQAWLSLEWTEHVALEIPHKCREYDLVGGALACTNEENLEIVWLPTSRNDKGRRLRRALNGIVPVPCFTMDPTQDLMAVLEDAPISQSTTNTATAHIHIRSISANVPHPSAQRGSLDFDVRIIPYTPNNNILMPRMEITHNILTLSYETCGRQMLIWDWMTSDLLLDSTTLLDSSAPFVLDRRSVCLLDSVHFLLAMSGDPGSIQLYKLTPSPSVNDAQAVHLATLHLPLLSLDSYLSAIDVQTEPIQTHPLPNTPFMTNNEDRLLEFWMDYLHYHYPEEQSHEGVSECAQMFVHQRVFTKYILQQTRLGDPPLDIPWAEWGPLNTRLICPSYDHLYTLPKRYIHGQRAIFSSPRPAAPTSVEILDFSLAAVLAAKGRLSIPPPSSSQPDHWKLSSSNLIEVSWECPFFADDIRTHLPCVCITRDLQQMYSTFMIHANGIIGVKVINDHELLSHVYAI